MSRSTSTHTRAARGVHRVRESLTRRLSLLEFPLIPVDVFTLSNPRRCPAGPSAVSHGIICALMPRIFQKPRSGTTPHLLITDLFLQGDRPREPGTSRRGYDPRGRAPLTSDPRALDPLIAPPRQGPRTGACNQGPTAPPSRLAVLPRGPGFARIPPGCPPVTLTAAQPTPYAP
jgi:hypothetical protein